MLICLIARKNTNAVRCLFRCPQITTKEHNEVKDMYTTINTVYCLSELSSIWNHLRIHIWLKGCSKSPQRSRPCMLHNFRFQSVIVIVNCSLYWMPHTQDGKPKTQKKHKSRWCSSRTCWSYPPKSRKSLSPAKVQQLEVRNMCLPIFYPDL